MTLGDTGIRRLYDIKTGKSTITCWMGTKKGSDVKNAVMSIAATGSHTVTFSTPL